MEKYSEFYDSSIDMLTKYGLKLLMAIIVLIVGLSIVNRIVRLMRRMMEKREWDPSLIPFISSVVGAVLKIMLFITVFGMLGVEMTSFIAVLGAAGLAVGLALQGSLSNFAGGVLILILKPFKVGDFIDGAGTAGTVREIQIFYTYLTTPAGQEIVVPNAKLSNDSITNFSYNPSRRLDMTFGISYGADIDKAKSILQELANEESRFIEDKGIMIFVEALADSSVNLRLRGWLNTGDYWDVLNNMNEKVKKAFDKAGVGIPFPQLDLHFVEDKTKKA